MKAGIYIHIPFCLRKCPYCDFYSLPYSDSLADDYTTALQRAIDTQPYSELKADTLYLGGGTPLLLGVGRLTHILEAAASAFGLDSSSEITLEANPAAALHTSLGALRRSGFNRISFGVQSLCESELQALGRLHGTAEAVHSIEQAAAAGFAHISADIMLAVPGQGGESLSRTIAGLAALPLDHISAYLLKLEEGTPFYRQRERLTLPDEDAAAELYLQCVQELMSHGFAQYEISNFARPGGKSRHNLKYWRCEPYLGIGPAAHSFLAGRRFFFPRELECFLASAQPFSLTRPDGEGGSFAERAMLALRLNEGFDPGRGPAAESMRRQAAALSGLCSLREGRIALTQEGFLLSNAVTASLLKAAEEIPC